VYRRWDDLGGPLGEHGNDLEPAALSVAPELARWRDELGEASGTRPMLAGSGSTWWVEGAYPGPGRLVARTVAPGVDPAGAQGPDRDAGA
jgi:4-diphosphocytidyl-2-C-methyl-D-erythritol kinase